ncbi:hypothetical protein OIV83_005046 [Microbotryomycetes sp. JL201]|nr:hypothetical protein OIV83_005046 [Microbotryomycetes sp. JL201]
MSSSSCARAGQVAALASNRSLVYKQHGDPKQVLSSYTYTLPALERGQMRVKFLLAAVNPADIASLAYANNVIQGVYPSKPPVRQDVGPEPVTIMGNEAVAQVVGISEDGQVEKNFKVGDRVVMGKGQLGTWQQYANLSASDLTPLPIDKPISDTQAATLSINPPTALRMLSDFVELKPEKRTSKRKPWVIQNGANSAVGTAVIQIAKSWNVGTINLVRDRKGIGALKSKLEGLGADHVLTYDEFLQKETRQQIKDWTKDGDLKLALNCVGGKETTEMAKLLGTEGCLVTYGGMAKTQLSLPPSLFIFKKLTAQVFPSPRQEMLAQLAGLVHDGKFLEPESIVVDISDSVMSDDKVTNIVRKTMEEIEKGKSKKVLFKLNE